MIGNESLNFLTRFYRHLLLQRFRLLHFEKILIPKSGARRSSNWDNS